MILLDIDNLNLLVLFILAFISFKGYQADDTLFDSESEDGGSETGQVDREHKMEEGQQGVRQAGSQKAQNEQPEIKMVKEPKNSDKTIEPVSEMKPEPNRSNENINHSHANDQIDQAELNVPKQSSVEVQKQGENSGEDQKMDEEGFESCQNEADVEINAEDEEFDSIDSSDLDGQDDGNPESPKKIKRIKKQAKRLRRDLKKNQELIKKVQKKIEQELERVTQESLEAK